MTGLDHETTAAVDEAAHYFANLSQDERRQRSAVPLLRERFGLTAKEACEALALAARLRGAA